LDGGARALVSRTVTFDENDTVVYENTIGGIQTSVVPAVDREFFAPDPDIGVAAGSVAPGSLSGFVGKSLGRGHAGAVAVGDHHGVAPDDGFHAAEEDVVLPAARGGKAESR
jgi:hypothetical protein